MMYHYKYIFDITWRISLFFINIYMEYCYKMDIKTDFISSADMYLLKSLSISDKKKYVTIKKQIMELEKEWDEYYNIYKAEKAKYKEEIKEETKKTNPNFSKK